MPFDQNGNFERLYGKTGWQDDRDADVNILASRHDEDANDTAAALNDCFLADGRKTAAGPFKMGGYRVMAMGDAAGAQDAATAKQAQTGVFNYGVDVSAEANAVKVNLTPAVAAYPGGMFVAVKIANSNTGKTTLQLNALEPKPVYLGEQEIAEGMLKAGKVYVFFYNGALGAFQLMPSGPSVGPVVPPFTMILLDHLLTGEAAVGWELQGTRCYKSKYWEQYQQLVDEYKDAVARTETVEGKEFSYKLNLSTRRRFYSKNDYDARFTLCGDSGGYVLDEETYSFYLPKCNNYLRPAVDADNLQAYQTDTMRPITGTFNGAGDNDWGQVGTGAFYKLDVSLNTDAYEGTTHPRGIGMDSARLGAHFAGTETAPKSRFVAVYYKMGSAYTEQMSQAVLAAERYAREAQASVDGIGADVKEAAASAAAARKAAEEAAASTLQPDGQTIVKSAGGVLTAAAVNANTGALKFWTGTQEEYDAIAAPDEHTLYIITEAMAA